MWKLEMIPQGERPSLEPLLNLVGYSELYVFGETSTFIIIFHLNCMCACQYQGFFLFFLFSSVPVGKLQNSHQFHHSGNGSTRCSWPVLTGVTRTLHDHNNVHSLFGLYTLALAWYHLYLPYSVSDIHVSILADTDVLAAKVLLYEKVAKCALYASCHSATYNVCLGQR